MKLNDQQEAAASAIDGCYVVVSGPGSGKTTVLVDRYIRMLTRGINTKDILNLTFTNAAAEQMVSRVGLTDAKQAFRTFHSLAIEILKKEKAHLDFELCDEVIPVKAQDYKLLDELVRQFPQLQYKKLREKIIQWKCENVTPKQAMEENEHRGLEYAYAMAYNEYEIKCREDGWLDFDDCIVEVVNLLETNPEVQKRWQRRYIAVDECQDTDVKQFKLLQLLFDGNIFAVGDENQCQPPGTLVDVLVRPSKGQTAALVEQVPIESLSETNDRLVSWDSHQKRTRLGCGRRFRRAVRQFDGNLLRIKANEKTTLVTPNHRLWVKFNRKALSKNTHFVYLMWQGDLGFRVGTSTLRTSSGANQISHRGYQEKADKMWVLDIVESGEEARIREEIYSLQYSIPEHCFIGLNKKQIKRVFDCVSWAGGFKLLTQKGLLFDFPLVSWGGSKKHQTRFHGFFKTAAANVVPGLMDLPTKQAYKSSLIESVEKIEYHGPVYSLDVEKDHTYVADGIPVGNCIYEWRSAQANNLTNFAQKFPGTKTLYLGQNYRSTKRLVEFFRENLPVDNGISDYMFTENEEGVDPGISEYEYDLQEAHAVLSKIKEPEKTAILARTNRQLFVFQKLCVRKGIKHKFKDSFWNQPEVRRLMKLAKDSNDQRSANIVLEEIIRQHNLIWVYRNTGEQDNDPAKNLNDAVKLSVNRGTVKEFQNFLHRLTYATKNSKLLTLSTVHQAKGKEYDHVFLIGCNHGKLPHKDAPIGEEKRIFFVAMSRAAKYFEISFYGKPSEFLQRYGERINVYEESTEA